MDGRSGVEDVEAGVGVMEVEVTLDPPVGVGEVAGYG